MAKQRTPNSQSSRYRNTGSGVVLPSRNLAGKSRASRPGSNLSRGDTIRNTIGTYVQNAISEVRSRQDINEILRVLMREDGLVSNAANSMVAIASQSGFRIAGRDSTGAMSMEVMSVAYSLLDRLNMIHDYSQGFNDKPGNKSLLATLQMDVIGTGGCGLELVLDPAFGPERLVPVGYSTIEWVADGKGGRYPTQDDGEIELNIPTVFIAEHNRNADEAYAASLLRPGLDHIIQFNEFLEDMHRSLNRVGHSRLVATLVAEKIAAAMPPEYQNDAEKSAKFFDDARTQVEEALAGLEPEDAIVSFDSVDYSVEDTGGSKSDYTSLLGTLGNLTGASLKTPASVSGLRAGGGQGLSNAETLIYLRVTEATRPPVEEVMSRALTLAIRLMGIDGYVSFEFMPINLRPEEELEAYKGTRQKRVLEQLSLGLINDAEACYLLGLRPQSMVAELAGTGFYSKNQSATSDEAERESSTGRALNPGTPSKSGGDDQ